MGFKNNIPNTQARDHKCKIGGQIIPYDGCSEKSLKEAKVFYKEEQWEYIGEGEVYSVSGIIQSNKKQKKHHFFIRKK